MLEVRRLLILRAVARNGSLAAAAREFSYTQPAVSHHIRRLEAEAGVRLIARDGRGVALTEAGRALVAHARCDRRRADRRGGTAGRTRQKCRRAGATRDPAQQ